MRNAAVDIGPDGSALVDSEPVSVPHGVDPSHAVLERLALEAAGERQPLISDIRDERTGQTLCLQVNPDGTTTPLAPGEHSPSRSQSPLPAPSTPPAVHAYPDQYKDELDAIYTAGRAHQFASAVERADHLLAAISASHGPTHPSTLRTAQVRADLAWMTADYPYATELWTYIATSWRDTIGPHARGASNSARQAVACWRLSEPRTALHLSTPLLAMLETIVPDPRTNPTVLGVHRRITELPSR